MEDTPNEDDPNTNLQITENFFFVSEYVVHIDSTNKKIDNIVAGEPTTTKAYESNLNNINHSIFR